MIKIEAVWNKREEAKVFASKVWQICLTLISLMGDVYLPADKLIKELSSLYDLEVRQNYILLILLSFASSFTWVLGFGYMY